MGFGPQEVPEGCNGAVKEVREVLCCFLLCCSLASTQVKFLSVNMHG
jgi:hypothetical protein